jgi:glutamyl-Q tRNA(Asp) synthetase
MRQSARGDAYRDAIARLEAQGIVYPCFCTRREIADEIARAVEAPHVSDPTAPRSRPDGPIYPGTCRHLSADERAAKLASGMPHALRLDAAKAAWIAGPLTFREHGATVAVQPLLFGDIVLARKEMPAAYHLAVVADDAFQGVTLVTRGNDLFAATHVQRLLQVLLGLPAPAYAHHRLILDAQGRKFSKRDRAATLRSLRAAGATPDSLRAMLSG